MRTDITLQAELHNLQVQAIVLFSAAVPGPAVVVPVPHVEHPSGVSVDWSLRVGSSSTLPLLLYRPTAQTAFARDTKHTCKDAACAAVPAHQKA